MTSKEKENDFKLKDFKGSYAKMKDDLLEGGKYYSQFYFFKDYWEKIYIFCKDFFSGDFKWTWRAIFTVLDLVYACLQIVFMFLPDTDKETKIRFAIACAEYIVEEKLQIDVPDWVWDFIYNILQGVFNIALKAFGQNLERNSAVTFMGRCIYNPRV